MPEYITKTLLGKFKITVNDDIKIDINTREITKIGKILTVGGINKCVGINAPYNSDIAHLLNIKRNGGGCELDGNEISGLKTVHMLNLAFTILKKEMLHIKFVKLEDRSDIPCKLKDGSLIGISLASQQLIFHQKTWYERYFNAKLINPILRKLYDESKCNFNKKPTTFNFINKDLNTVLTPLFDESTSWKDFFHKINTMKDKCQIILFWYPYALKEIFQNVSFERQDWIIELNSIENIDYTILKPQQGGKRSRTYKHIEYTSINQLSYDDIENYTFEKNSFKLTKN